MSSPRTSTGCRDSGIWGGVPGDDSRAADQLSQHLSPTRDPATRTLPHGQGALPAWGGLWGTFMSLSQGGYDATIPQTGRNHLIAGHRFPQQWMSPSPFSYSAKCHPVGHSCPRPHGGVTPPSHGVEHSSHPRQRVPPSRGPALGAAEAREAEQRAGASRSSPSLHACLPSRAEPSRAMGPASPRPAQPCWAPRAAAMMRSASLRRARDPRRRRGGRARRAA